MACFPWTAGSLDSLWAYGYAAVDPDLKAIWDTMVREWIGTVAVGSHGSFYIFPKLATAKTIHVRLPDVSISSRVLAQC